MTELIFGPNILACRGRLDEVVGELTEAPISLDLSDADNLKRLAELSQEASLFSAENCLIVRYADEQSSQFDKLVEIATNTPTSTQLVIYQPGLKKSHPLVKRLLKVADKQTYCDLLGEGQLIAWLKDQAGGMGSELTDKTARFLIQWSGHDQLRLSRELQRLSLVVDKIEIDHIKKYANPAVEATIFDLLDAMVAGQTKQALQRLKTLRNQQLDSGYVLNMIAWQAQALTAAVLAKGLDRHKAAAQSGLSAFVIGKAGRLARRLTRQQMARLNDQILRADELSKTVNINNDVLVEQLIRKVAAAA